MTVTPGSRHDHYEIVEMIGKGGMGEVYRARDTRLPRDVAIKVSAQQFSERFAREAKVIASLNHPNISTLFDVGPNYLVMELVEGPTLSDCIEEGGLPLEEASRIAQQVADALDYAHEKGVVHRDLKPGNIKIRPDGVVKVLDFGLAKMGGVPVGQSDASPTVTIGETEAGVILGTAAYMSPEQAKGKTVDKRADIWAFGVVFYEMLAGKRLFAGDSMSETLANVIKEEPKWDRVPPQAHRLLRQCLEKDPQKRLRHIGDVMRLLDDAATAERSGVGIAAPLGASPQRKWLWPGIAAAVVAIAAVVVWAPWQSRDSGPAIRFEIQPTEKITFINGSYPMVSPNGKWVVFPAIGADGVRRMYLRALDSVEVRPLAGTESQNPLQPPVYWSPDSRFIAFSSNPAPFAPGQLKKLDISGGPPTTICETRGAVVGLTWNRDGVIVFGDNGSIRNLMRVSAAGGVATPVTVRRPVARGDLSPLPAVPAGRQTFFVFSRREHCGKPGDVRRLHRRQAGRAEPEAGDAGRPAGNLHRFAHRRSRTAADSCATPRFSRNRSIPVAWSLQANRFRLRTRWAPSRLPGPACIPSPKTACWRTGWAPEGIRCSSLGSIHKAR